ncbi:MAG: hypothetical protein U1F43_12610 [Myxococcota bacterium]
MMRAEKWLLTVLAVASMAAVGCGGDTKKAGDTTSTTDATVTPDGTDATTNPDVTSPTDATTTPDADSCSCGTRECGTFAGCQCGTCDVGEICSAQGKCEAAGNPMGSFCGITATCTSDSPSYPDCIDNQCASRNCLSNNSSALVLRDVCSAGCQIYQDDDNNGVNDANAPLDDCNPDDIVDGPAGNAFRCVNFAGPGASPVGLCTPGSEFPECAADSDCDPGEGCELTTIGGDYNFRCVANYQENSTWSANVVGMAESCNDDPAAGDVRYCKSGLCFGLGCVTACKADSDCDTTKVFADTGCDTTAHTCKGNPGKACTADIDCSGWECGEARQILGDGQGGLAGPFWELCWPKSCATDDECGGGFYCRFFWNGVGGDGAALDNLCLRQNPDGVNLGDKCDPDTSDNIPGDVCKNEDLCIGGYCSTLCGSDADCSAADGQVCAVAELPGDEDDDGTDDFVLPVKWCQTYPGATSDCLTEEDCGTGESCQVFEVENPDETGRTDSPFVLAGKCQNVAAEFPGTAGEFGASCTGGSECKSGFCLGATDTTPGFCTKVCGATSECGSVTIGTDTGNGICASLLLGYGGDIDDSTNAVYIPLCVLTTDSLEDCSADLSCTAENEICSFNVVATDATHPAKVEYLCSALVDPGDDMPTGAVGSACNLNPADGDPPQCAGGYCLEDKDGNGYCSKPCKAAGDCSGGTTCTDTATFARVGKYEANSGSVGLCRKDVECETCYGQFDCPGDLVCSNLGTNNTPDFRCVPGCTDASSCTNETGKQCNDSADERGVATKGCFDKNGATPVNYCKQ